MIIGPKLPQSSEILSFENFLTARAQHIEQNSLLGRSETHNRSNSSQLDRKKLILHKENNKKTEEINPLLIKNGKSEKEVSPNETNDSNKIESHKILKRPENLLIDSSNTNENKSDIKKIIKFFDKNIIFGSTLSPGLSPSQHTVPSRNNFLTILNKAKNLAKKIKKDLFYKDIENMSSHSKKILNDRSHYEIHKGKKNVNKNQYKKKGGMSYFFVFNLKLNYEIYSKLI